LNCVDVVELLRVQAILAWSGKPGDGRGYGLSSAAARSWRTGSAPGGTAPCSASTRWPSMKLVDENYLPVVVGVAVVGDRVLRLRSVTVQPEMSTSPLNGGHASFLR